MTPKWIVAARVLAVTALMFGGWVLIFRGLWDVSHPLGLIGLGIALLASGAMRMTERQRPK